MRAAIRGIETMRNEESKRRNRGSKIVLRKRETEKGRKHRDREKIRKERGAYRSRERCKAQRECEGKEMP